jgi:hypothetical protein
MGFFDFLSWETTCPLCGAGGARKPLFGRVKCPNRDCANFDMELFSRREEAAPKMETSTPAPGEREGRYRDQRYRDPRTGELMAKKLREDFQPGAFSINVYYRNFRGEDKTFVGDRRTLRGRGKHVSLQLAPTGRRAAFDRDRIRNLPEIEQALSQTPTPREQWVMYFHASRGSTSALNDRLREKYPQWLPEQRVR